MTFGEEMNEVPCSQVWGSTCISNKHWPYVMQMAVSLKSAESGGKYVEAQV